MSTATATFRESSTRAPRLRSFDLARHLAATRDAKDPAAHIKLGLMNFLATELQKGAVNLNPKYPPGFVPRDGQYQQIEHEMHSLRSKARYIEVIFSMPFLGGLNDHGVDFAREVVRYSGLDYHKYYLQPFHSVPGGWLSPLAASGNEAAMRALFRKSHKRGAEGLRETVASLVPRDAKVVYDFGAACGAQGKAFAERLGVDAKVYCVDPSPFGLILGQKQFTDPRLQWVHGFAEDLTLEENSADVVNLLFVLHETPDYIKRKLLAQAFRVLKPGGLLMAGEPPAWDLEHRSAGFFEPYRDQWLVWETDREMRAVGFADAKREDIVDPDYMWSYVATKPR